LRRKLEVDGGYTRRVQLSQLATNSMFKPFNGDERSLAAATGCACLHAGISQAPLGFMR
jgi:hypothetical protein